LHIQISLFNYFTQFIGAEFHNKGVIINCNGLFYVKMSLILHCSFYTTTT